ncbi:hypothetical protein [Rhizobium sp. 18065]|uniref:hypothetical protein n=1 Tax=Rhizobium sp. 18065 TaxID=2681411 RepID=UPI001358E0DA|nr:hypothetical protein [Rhizobium sp. 18065]
MSNLSIQEFVSERALMIGLKPDDIDGEAGSIARVLRWVLDGKAKLPLDRVVDAADALACDPRQLFQHALKQFFNDEAIDLFENMMGSALSTDELAWLAVIRKAAGARMKPPSWVAQGVIQALLAGGTLVVPSAENPTAANR